MMAEGEAIDVHDLPESLRARAAQGTVAQEDGWLTLAEMERRYILRVLESVGGNKVQAAKILGIHRATIHRLLGEPEPEREPDVKVSGEN